MKALRSPVQGRPVAKRHLRDGHPDIKPDIKDVNRGTDASGDAARDPQTLTRLLSDPDFRTDIESVFAHLFARWKQDYHALPGMTPCERAQGAGLECLHKSGTWESLRTYNLPAVIEISATEDKTHRALVEELQGDQITLDFGTDRRTWPVTEVASLWHGDYLLLWRPPPFKTRRIPPGIQGPDVLWLRQQITQLEGQPLPAVDESVYDEILENRVMAFQQSRSLIPDGVVGEQTLIHLSTALKDRAVPLLAQPSPSAASQQSSR
jgi:general secretion pathway protein A